MAYRNKTFVSFASEDINYYRLMQAWKANEHIDFNFYDAHDLNTALDSSQQDTIERRLSEFVDEYATNIGTKSGPHQYPASVHTGLGL
jgi:hypothetical protein